ncbi:MAG TPA: AI-2E family transporter [Gaiellaceae bacterium]|nr:AI-2E family transporter [Gaiellaceae bacterium]
MPPGNGSNTIVIPRWIQLVGLPIALVAAWLLLSAVSHVVLLFLVAALVAILLEPLVRALHRVWIPRGLSIAIVYLSFTAAVVVVVAALGVVVVDRTEAATNRIDAYLTEDIGQTGETEAERDVDRFQVWLDDHGLERIKIRRQGQDLVDRIQEAEPENYTSDVVAFIEGAAFSIFELLFSLVLILVVSIYMLLDMDRLARGIDRRFPPAPGSQPLLRRVETAVAGYVKGQVLVSLIIGVSAGVGLWLIGTLGWADGQDDYALLFGSWVAFAELIPYLGPWLGAIPPLVYALVVDPFSAVWVALLFLGIHQIEGHVVVPKVMGTALRLHPLLVIFGLLAGAQIYGLPGVFLALPTLAALRAVWEFFGERVRFERWEEGGPVPLDVELEIPEAPVPVGDKLDE